MASNEDDQEEQTTPCYNCGGAGVVTEDVGDGDFTSECQCCGGTGIEQ